MARTLIKNGSLVTVDDKLGDIPGGDIVIEDDKIVAIGRKLAAGGAQDLKCGVRSSENASG